MTSKIFYKFLILVVFINLFFIFTSQKQKEIKKYTLDDLVYAIIKNDKPKIKTILKNSKLDLNIPITKGKRVIHFAVRYSDLEIVKLLVKKGAKINVKDNKGRTPLHTAAHWNKYKIAEYLIHKGVDVNAKTNLKSTPLLMAVYYSDFPLVKLLIDKKADVNAMDKYKNSPLHWAVLRRNPKDKIKIIKYLIQHGANTKTKNYLGKTPLDLSKEKEVNKILKSVNKY